jgi:hypothetical protein
VVVVVARRHALRPTVTCQPGPIDDATGNTNTAASTQVHIAYRAEADALLSASATRNASPNAAVWR